MDFQRDSVTGGVLIPLQSKTHSGLFAIVDEQDVECVARFIWWPRHNATKGSRRTYADSSHFGRRVVMHRVILDVTDPTLHVDHINHNGLDNRRANLRVVTRKQNHANRRPIGATSQYKGVSWNRGAGKWHAKLRIGGKTVHIGYFTDEVAAARAFDRAAHQHAGEFAYLNFPEEAR